jgi:hypothetical protein
LGGFTKKQQAGGRMRSLRVARQLKHHHCEHHGCNQPVYLILLTDGDVEKIRKLATSSGIKTRMTLKITIFFAIKEGIGKALCYSHGKL